MQACILDHKDFGLIKDIFLDVFSNEPWNDKWDSDEQLAGYLNDLTGNNNSLSLVLKDQNGEIIGASLGYIFHWWHGREYYIKEFFISRSKQHQGLGTSFIKLILQHLKSEGIKSIYLSTERNFPAYNFYLKNGFEEIKDYVFLSRSVE